MKKLKYIVLLFFSIYASAQQTLTYEYDGLDRLIKVHYSDGTILYYTFDAVGNRTEKTVSGNCRVRDSLALVAFYNAADGDNWHNTLDNNQKWLEGSMDTWYGVTMTEGGCRVESIFLRNDALNGTISPKIGDLDSLKTLTLSFNNQLSGSLPLEFSNLKNLEEINFTRSNLSGAIDPIFDLESLRILHISDNEFNGTIDGLIDNTNLERLFIGGNNFTGTLEVVSNLLKLRSLSASYNNFDGEIPTGIVNLVDLESLDLNSTFLGGEIPSDIGNLTKLTSLNLHQAALTGSVPNSISNLTQLEFLYLEINYLNGNIDFLSDLTALKQVRLDNNNFSGSIPEDMDNLSSLTYIDLQINENIVGAFPSSLCNITTLEKAYFGRTQISGSLPDCITNLPNLESLSVQNTLMSGTVPNFSSTPNLEFLDLAVCHFTFEGIEENVNYFNNSPTFNYFDYSFQANIPLFQTGSGEFYVDAGGTLANNTYKWYKDNDISPIFTSIGNNTYTPTNSGTYYCKITNSICTGLELRTEDIDFEDCDIVFVSYSSGNFPDVVNAQEFIEIQNATIQSGQNKELRAGNYILFDTGTIIEDGSTVTSEIAACSTTSASKSSSNSEEAHSQVSLTPYPNPFSDKLTVEYTLPTESEVSLQIVDISGKLQKTLVTQQTQEKGVYTIKWNSCKLPIGVYHCILDVNGERYSYKLVKN